MKKKIIATIVILFLGSAAVAGSWAASKLVGVLLALVFLAVLGAIWGAFKRKPRETPAPAPEAASTPKAEPAPKAEPVTVTEAESEHEPEDLSAFQYSYTRVGLYRPAKEKLAPIPPIGTALLLEPEEDNPYDAETIRAAYYRDGMDLRTESPVVGYMNKGELRNMVRDFLRRGDIVTAVLTQAEPKVEISIGMSRAE